MIEDYIFMDEDGTILEEGGYWDESVAEKYCERFVEKYKKTVICYKKICAYSLGDPVEIKP